MHTYLSGVKSELAIVRTLLDNGYRVILPNYLKRTDKAKGRVSETLEWDVKSGVDLVGVAPDGTIFLIDAKGRKYANDTQNEDEREINRKVVLSGQTTLQGPNGLPQSLAKKIDDIRAETGIPDAGVKRVKIIIPTDSSQLGKLGSKKIQIHMVRL